MHPIKQPLPQKWARACRADLGDQSGTEREKGYHYELSSLARSHRVTLRFLSLRIPLIGHNHGRSGKISLPVWLDTASVCSTTRYTLMPPSLTSVQIMFCHVILVEESVIFVCLVFRRGLHVQYYPHPRPGIFGGSKGNKPIQGCCFEKILRENSSY